ncbi:MAG TPA: hypothetical protein VFE52_09655 [Devosia sp.]|jgi:hypothetical protein|nr:hypothetical protein [Devosia sp.]
MDDEPLRTTTFTLTRADALAYEQAASRLAPLGTMALVLWLGLCGSAAWLLPADWSGPHLGWSFSILVSICIAIGYVLVLLVMAFRQWWRAAKRIGRPQEVTVTEWPDRLELRGQGLPPELHLRDIRESILDRAHLFLVSDDAVLIVPRDAFAEEGVVEALADRIAGRPAPPMVDAGPRAA